MGTCVHRNGEGVAARYRLWTTTEDRYLTVPLTREQMRGYMVWRRACAACKAIDEIDDLLMVAEHRGTSSRFEQREASGWETEKNHGPVYSTVYDQPVAVGTDGETVTVGTLEPMTQDEAMDLAARIMVAVAKATR